jgi:Tfp pilus assembly protein PilF
MTSDSPFTPSSPETWTTTGFVGHFKRIDETMKDRAFAFILGAGASVSSGIPTGGKLVDRWLEEMFQTSPAAEEGASIEQWATEHNLNIDGFDYQRRASFYPQIYDRRFRDDPAEGHASLEDVMKDAVPRFGYSVLAQVLARTRHNVALTTNFDDLVEEALAVYTDAVPLVCGHESLAGFVTPKPSRPLIAKVHRDLLLAPQNSPAETILLHEDWIRALREVLKNHTPIVIGYGGNDGSVMNFLLSLGEGSIPGGLFWCYRRAAGPPERRIQRLVQRHRGKLVEIEGFDELMLEFFTILGYDLLDTKIIKSAEEQARSYREHFDQLRANLAKPGETKLITDQRERSLRMLDERLKKLPDYNWWAWELKAKSEKDENKREAIYREAITKLPRSAELAANFAVFLKQVRKDYDEAETLYRRSLKLEPNLAENVGNFAAFMHEVRKDYDEAERLYRRALELDPKYALVTGNFAIFLYEVRKEHDEAERLFRRGLELDPERALITGNFAVFMYQVRKDYDEAERLYRRSLDLDPNYAIGTGNFALFLQHVRRDYDEAERLLRKALDLDPNNAGHIRNFAAFVWQVRGDTGEAERLCDRAIELDPENADGPANFAALLLTEGRSAEAQANLDKASALLDSRPTQTAAEVALHSAVTARLDGRDDRPSLGRLKGLLATGFDRSDWSFEPLLKSLGPKLPPDDLALYEALAAAILDPEKVAPLDEFARWKEIEPDSPDA